MNPDLIVGVTLPCMFGWFAWIIFSTFRRYKIARLQADVHSRLLEKIGSGKTSWPTPRLMPAGSFLNPCRWTSSFFEDLAHGPKPVSPSSRRFRKDSAAGDGLMAYAARGIGRGLPQLRADMR